MVTTEERNEIVNEALEKFMLLIPQIAEIMSKNVERALAMQAHKTKFYADHKEFEAYKDVVAKVLQSLDDKHPGIAYKELTDKAIPLIQFEIANKGRLNLTKPEKPTREMLNVPLGGDAGAL